MIRRCGTDMLPRGKKRSPDGLKLIRGTYRPSRARRLTTAELAGTPRPPAWLTKAAQKIFTAKLATFAARGQAVAGAEGPLAMLCALEAEIGRRWRRGEHVPCAILNCYRLYCGEFHLTPASSVGTQAPAGGPINPFARHGRPPRV